MNKFLRKIDIFCYKHPNFGIKNIMLYVVIGNVVIWLFSMMDSSGNLLYYLTFNPQAILHGQVWRLLTFALIPNSSGIWALIMFYFYYFIGNTLESYWGTPKFNIYFFTGILLTIIYGFLIYFITGYSYNISATYIYLSMFFSFAALFPDTTVLLFFIIPMKIKWLAYVDAAFFLIAIFTTSFPINLLPVVAIINFLIFCWDRVFGFIGKSRNSKAKVINYKREAKKVNKAQNKATYNRKCEVCGKTDTDYPMMEFRYCSQCTGYHCYCIDHINKHAHHID